MTEIEDIIPFNLTNDITLLNEIVKDMIEENITTKEKMDKFIRKKTIKHSISISNGEILYTYRQYCKEHSKYDKRYELLLQKKSYRSKSGVMPVAIVTSPYPNGQSFSCKWNCKYCPLQPGQPRSYLKEEPGVLRANRHNFDPVLQLRDRGQTFFVNGHPVDKLEIIVLGGTWSSYPIEYQEDFITKIYYAANTFFDNIDVTKLREMKTLEEEIKINETCESRIIGLTIETRPDCINSAELKRYRRYGVTRVQMGIQHINDRVLERVNRMCSIKRVKKAIKLLKDNCFKVDGHIMPDLPKPLLDGVNPKKILEHADIDWDFDMYEEDKHMLNEFITNPDLQIDQAKIYPFEVVPYTELKNEYDNKLHKSYAEELIVNPYANVGKQTKNSQKFTKLHELLIEFKSKVPKYIRLNRIIRDIPTQYICGGASDVSMRQVLQSEMKKRGLECKCIRCREIMNKKIDKNLAILSVNTYEASDGTEYFISFETPDEKTLFGFCRLRLTKNSGKGVFDELFDCALLRELHVYGQTVAVSDKSISEQQHSGFGKKLVNKAFEIAIENGYTKIAVISGVGVKNYYKKFGFKDAEYFMIKDFNEEIVNSLNKPINEEIVNLLNKPINERNNYYKYMTYIIYILLVSYALFVIWLIIKFI
jgi:ELP3 family radical SAM enzyme/protein acetyltransferase